MNSSLFVSSDNELIEFEILYKIENYFYLYIFNYFLISIIFVAKPVQYNKTFTQHKFHTKSNRQLVSAPMLSSLGLPVTKLGVDIQYSTLLEEA